MKKVKKLVLNTQKVAQLSSKEMNQLNGGKAEIGANSGIEFMCGCLTDRSKIIVQGFCI